MGNAQTVEEITTDCDPIIKNSDLAPYITKAADGTTPLVADEPANPCGLIAKSLFTDTFGLLEDPTGAFQGVQPLTINDTNIAWKSDVAWKFKRLNTGQWDTVQWTDVSNRKKILHIST